MLIINISLIKHYSKSQRIQGFNNFKMILTIIKLIYLPIYINNFKSVLIEKNGQINEKINQRMNQSNIISINII